MLKCDWVKIILLCPKFPRRLQTKFTGARGIKTGFSSRPSLIREKATNFVYCASIRTLSVLMRCRREFGRRSGFRPCRSRTIIGQVLISFRTTHIEYTKIRTGDTNGARPRSRTCIFDPRQSVVDSESRWELRA